MTKVNMKEAKSVFLQGGNVYIETEEGFKKMDTFLTWENAKFNIKMITSKSRLSYFID